MDSQKLPIKLLKATFNNELVNELLFCLEKYFIVTKEGETISIHRKTQHMGLRYICEIITENERDNSLEKILKVLTPYEKINKEYADLKQFTPHLRAFLTHLEELDIEEDKKNKFRIDLLVTVGNIYRYKERFIEDSINYFEEALKLNSKCNHLSKYAITKIILTAGESCVLLSQNDSAEKHLKNSLISLEHDKKHITDLANNLRLLGIIYTRRNEFEKANSYFDKALILLEKSNPDIASKLVIARAYAAKSLNYLTRYINKDGMKDAVALMEKALKILEECLASQISSFDESMIIREITSIKIHLSGLENGIMHHDIALKLAKETEALLKKLPDEDNSSFCTFGMVYMEKGHAYLRMNDLKKAKEMFSEARKVCDKAPIDDYIWRIRMQQTETLIRLGELEEAYKNCVYMFNLKNRERNIGGDIFYNTCHYNAAVIKYRMGEISKSLEHFRDFSISMQGFCKEFLEKKDYEKLLHERAFEIISNESEIKKCFENAFKIFSAICMKGSGFITDYVQKNLLNL